VSKILILTNNNITGADPSIRGARRLGYLFFVSPSSQDVILLQLSAINIGTVS